MIKQARGPNKIFKFLFTQDSVYNYGTQSFPEPIFSWFDQGGQSMFSQQGDKYATTCRGTGKIFVANFNRCDGELSNPKVYNLPELNAHNPNDSTMKDIFSEGLAFSPNGRFIYVYMYYNIQQLDLWDNDSTSQWSVVAELDTTWNAFSSYSSSYLGPDNKLYIGNFALGFTNSMSYFNNPDVKGLGSNFCKRCLVLPKQGVTRPPTMPNYDLGMDSTWCWPLSQSESAERRAEWNFYPNPASETIIIQNATGKKKVLYSALGEAILSTTKNELDVSRLPQGVYYLFCDNTARKVVVE